tara:strand:+ start:969 stop:1430 length:462 start_codon:yes stop_codon:yes gene_type:complete
MQKKYNFVFLNKIILFLLFYNVFTLFILYTNNINFKSFFWTITPYDYKKLILSPYSLEKKSLLEKKNRNSILDFLNMNKTKNYLQIDFWNYKKTIESFDLENSYEFEKSFYKNLILSKNNYKKNKTLKKYFINNYNNFSIKNKNNIIQNFNLK